MTLDLMRCRVCNSDIVASAFDDEGPSLTSIRTVLDVRTQVWLCDNCGHAQSPDLPNILEFYDTNYRISLDIDGHDQVYENRAGEQVFRTVYQAELVQALDLPKAANVMDFGAGKATTLQQLLKVWPDVVPYVFDVSTDYAEYWADWVPINQQATYELPQDWTTKFDLITAHFVLEHVADPVRVFKDISRCLLPDGKLFFSVPNAETNSGDLLVVDHLNHFTLSSVTFALAQAKLIIENIDCDAFSGAFVIIAKKGLPKIDSFHDNKILTNVLFEWEAILQKLKNTEHDAPLAIYGAGFYGSLIATRLNGSIDCFLDKNPYLQNCSHLNIPILNPNDCPNDVKAVIVGLNPARAREILGNSIEWLPNGAELVYLD